MLSTFGRIAESVLVRLPRWILPPLIIEAAARSVGGIAQLCYPRMALGGEYRIRGALSAARLKARGLRLGRRNLFEGLKNIVLEDDVTLYGDSYFGATGPQGRLRIGENTHLDRQTVVHGQGGAEIGRGCAIAAGVIVYTQTNRFAPGDERPILEQGIDYAPVRIGDDVWIGAGAMILPGISIGDHAVVAAGAVVHRDVEPWKIVAGVPAKEIKDRRARR